MIGRFFTSCLGMCLWMSSALSGADASSGEALYRERCAQCHDEGLQRAPKLEALAELSPGAVERSLTSGSMRAFGQDMTADELSVLARFVGRAQAEAALEAGGCPDHPDWDPKAGPSWVGWSPDLENTRYQPAESARLTREDVSRLEFAWAWATPGAKSARGAVSVAGGRLFTGRSDGSVLSLDARSGCSYWTIKSKGGVRGAVVLGEIGGRPAAYFGDSTARAYAVDARTGEAIWETKLDEHPAAVVTGSLTLYEGRLYIPLSSYEEATGARPTAECCRFRGSVVALDAATGERAWKTYTIAEEPSPRAKNARGVQQWGPSGAAIWSAPTIDRKLNRLYVTTGDNYSDPPNETSDAMIALDLPSGEIVWHRQFTEGDAYNMACGGRRSGENCPEAKGPDYDFGSSAILRELPGGRRVLVAGQKSGWVHAVDPDRDGKILWQRQAGEGGVLGGIQFGSAADESSVYVAVSDLRFGRGGPDPNQGGGVKAFNLATGEPLWEQSPGDCAGRSPCTMGHSGAATAIPGVVFAGSLDGRIRAFDSETGEVIWEYDTVRDFETVNGVEGRGGALNAAGPVVVDGMVFVNSGYGQFGTAAGNVLLAFRAGAKR